MYLSFHSVQTFLKAGSVYAIVWCPSVCASVNNYQLMQYNVFIYYLMFTELIYLSGA